MSANAICGSCYEEIPPDGNPKLVCPKCGTENATESVSQRATQEKPPVLRQDNPPQAVDKALVVLVALAGLMFVIGLFTSTLTAALRDSGVVCVSGLIYLAPAICGKKKKNSTAIFVLNLFLGWTFVGWVVALVWAVTKD